MDQAGNLYGTTLVGGANNLGAVYQLSPPPAKEERGRRRSYFRLAGPMAPCPSADCSSTEAAALYGTTDGGGSGQAGTVFQLTPSPSRVLPWSESVLYNFSGGIDGGNPVAGVIIDNRGRLFGTASTGGNGRPDPGGVIFRLDPPENEGDPWTERVLHAFGGPDGFRSLPLVRRGGGCTAPRRRAGLTELARSLR